MSATWMCSATSSSFESDLSSTAIRESGGDSTSNPFASASTSCPSPRSSTATPTE